MSRPFMAKRMPPPEGQTIGHQKEVWTEVECHGSMVSLVTYGAREVGCSGIQEEDYYSIGAKSAAELGLALLHAAMQIGWRP